MNYEMLRKREKFCLASSLEKHNQKNYLEHWWHTGLFQQYTYIDSWQLSIIDQIV